MATYKVPWSELEKATSLNDAAFTMFIRPDMPYNNGGGLGKPQRAPGDVLANYIAQHSALKAALNGETLRITGAGGAPSIKQRIDQVEQVATGAQLSIVFETTAQMTAWKAGTWNFPSGDPAYGKTPANLAVGAAIYVRNFGAGETPHKYWWDGANIREQTAAANLTDEQLMSATLVGMAALALDAAGLANREGKKTIGQRMQTGRSLIYNRGVITGCAVTKSTARRLSVAAGGIYANGMELSVEAMPNIVNVPENPGAVAQVCYLYIAVTPDNEITPALTTFGAIVPDGGIPLRRISVPAGNTAMSDGDLSAVTITTAQRVEEAYPALISNAAYASVALPYSMPDNDYEIHLDIESARGGGNPRSTVYAGAKAANGFKVFVESYIDVVNVRWTAIKLSL